MNGNLPSPPGFWQTVRLLLRAARKRSRGRANAAEAAASAAFRQPIGASLGFAVSVLFMALLNVFAAFVLRIAVTSGATRLKPRITGRSWSAPAFLQRRSGLTIRRQPGASPRSMGVTWKRLRRNSARLSAARLLPPLTIRRKPRHIAAQYGGKAEEIEEKLREAVRKHGVRDLISNQEAVPGVAAFMKSGPLPAMLGSVVLIWWAVMLVFQGEGVEFDLQRRRHPYVGMAV